MVKRRETPGTWRARYSAHSLQTGHGGPLPLPACPALSEGPHIPQGDPASRQGWAETPLPHILAWPELPHLTSCPGPQASPTEPASPQDMAGGGQAVPEGTRHSGAPSPPPWSPVLLSLPCPFPFSCPPHWARGTTGVAEWALSGNSLPSQLCAKHAPPHHPQIAPRIGTCAPFWGSSLSLPPKNS